MTKITLAFTQNFSLRGFTNHGGPYFNHNNQIIYQFYDKPDHIAKNYHHLYERPSNKSSKPGANHVSSSTITNSGWLVDSVASHQVTGDLQNLPFRYEYHDPDELFIGDGLGLPISHISYLLNFKLFLSLFHYIKFFVFLQLSKI